MTHTYEIRGMTCSKCVNTVKTALSGINNVQEVAVTLNPPQAVITMKEHIPLSLLNKKLAGYGNYSLTESENGIMAEGYNSKNSVHNSITAEEEERKPFFKTYKPVLLVFAYLLGTVILSAASSEEFDLMALMHLFMGGFFLVFSFFKMLDLKGFAYSYMSYDIIAKKWLAWGYIYPFIELALGLAYLFHFMIPQTIIVTLVVMSLSSVGVVQSIFLGRKIQCACLGTVFNLPMSNITLIEDLSMVAMSAVMLVI